jgi:hypothetical protein
MIHLRTSVLHVKLLQNSKLDFELIGGFIMPHITLAKNLRR